MSLDKWIVAVGIGSFLLVCGVTVLRQRRLEVGDIGVFLGAYMSGCNIPAAIFLCWYAFDPDPPSVATKLHGCEKYVAMAGLALLSLACIGLWLLVKKAYEVAETPVPEAQGS